MKNLNKERTSKEPLFQTKKLILEWELSAEWFDRIYLDVLRRYEVPPAQRYSFWIRKCKGWRRDCMPLRTIIQQKITMNIST